MPATTLEYRTRYKEFVRFLAKEGLSHHLDKNASAVGEAIVQYLHCRFFSGYDQGDGSKFVPAFQYIHPEYSRQGRGTVRSKRGCRPGHATGNGRSRHDNKQKPDEPTATEPYN